MPRALTGITARRVQLGPRSRSGGRGAMGRSNCPVKMLPVIMMTMAAGIKHILCDRLSADVASMLSLHSRNSPTQW